MHKQLLVAFNEILKEPHDMPRWMTEGTAYLLPKSTNKKSKKLQAHNMFANHIQNTDSNLEQYNIS